MNKTSQKKAGWTAKDYLNECRRILGIEDKAACYWDLKMTNSEKRVILQAATLPTTTEHINRRFKAWTAADQRRIKEAAKRASEWAQALEVAQ